LPDALIIRQGGLRFHWDRDRHIAVRQPYGSLVDELTVPAGRFADGATLDEVHEVIDDYCSNLEVKGQ